MGHRTNYAILDQGQLRLFYSHWGALSVAQDLFWGPEHAIAFITEQEEVDPGRWLDEIWCEGGAALNADTKTLCLFGGEGIEYPDAARDAYIELLGALWGQHGWSVSWAHAGIHDLVACVGADPTLVEAAPDCEPLDLDTLGASMRTAERVYPRTILSVRGQDGAWTSVIDDEHISRMLATGPALLDQLHKLVRVDQLQQLREDSGLPLATTPIMGLVIDPSTHHIIAHGADPRRSEQRLFTAAWDGWTIAYQSGDLATHYELIAQPMPAYLSERYTPEQDDSQPQMSREAAVAYIAELLLEQEFGDPVKAIHALIAEHAEHGAPGAPVQVTPDTPLDEEERRAIIASALSTLYAPA
jgi:hypothetical protein